MIAPPTPRPAGREHDIPDPLVAAELLCARLCHDLSGLAGTLMGALELAADTCAQTDEALSLAHETSRILAARLRLFRAAWAGDCGDLSADAITALARGIPAGSRVQVDGSGLPPDPIPAPMARVVLNLVLLGAESLPGGGVIALAGNDGEILVALDGPRAAWPGGLAAGLVPNGPAPAFSNARQLQLPLTLQIARAEGVRLSLLLSAAGPEIPPPLLAQWSGPAS